MILFICNTPFQLFNAIRIKTTIYINETADIILSNHSKVDIYRKSLCDSGIFQHVYSASSLKLARNFFSWPDHKKGKAFNNSRKYLKNIFLPCREYNTIFFANIDGFTSLLFRYCVTEGFKTQFSYYEDGWSSYIIDLEKYSLSPYEKYYSEILNQKILQTNIKDIWLYDKRLYCLSPKIPIESIPQIDIYDNQFKKLINRVFIYRDNNEYHCKHIFLEEAFNEDGYYNNDLQIIKTIKNYVGENNFIVKRHPRLSADRYIGTGIKTSSDTRIPWEVLILNMNSPDMILYTISSNACLTPAIVFNIEIPIFYFRSVLRGNVSHTYRLKEFDVFLQKYKSLYGKDTFFEITSLGQYPAFYTKYFYYTQKKALRKYLLTEDKNSENCSFCSY